MCRRWVRKTETGSKWAASMTTWDVVRRELGGRAAHHPRQADRARVVGDEEVLLAQRARDPVEGGQLLPRGRAADPDRAGQLVAVVAVDRLAELEHHVVGDVDGQRDRAHAGELDPAGQPGRGGRGRVEAGHGAGHEDRAAGGVVDLDRVGAAVDHRCLPQGGVAVVGAEPEGRVAGHPPQGQRVGTVGVDLELDHLVAQGQHPERVVARLPGVGRQHQDAVARGRVLQAELGGGADHARRDVAVGLAGADLEASGEHATGQHHDDQVADGEVVRAADDALRLSAAVGRPDVHGAPADDLAVLLRLVLDGEHPAQHEGSLQVVAGTLERLELQPQGGEPGGEVRGGQVVGQVDVLTDPGDGGAHELRSRFRRRW